MYEVEWMEGALAKLTDFWNSGDTDLRKELTQACHEIDRRLERSPETEGESREGNQRILFAGPLVVIFHFDTIRRIATVVRVHLMKSR